MRHRLLNHVALHVADVARSVRFYEGVLQLEAMPRPAFDFPGAWFRLGTDQELHLIAKTDAPVQAGNRHNHFALLVDDMDAWERHLRAQQATYQRRVRPDAAHQIFLTDPDGHWIELCTAPGTASA